MNSESAPITKVEAFIRFLVAGEIVDETVARRALEKKDRVDLRVGKVALLEGFITPEEINKILWVQREAHDKKFGEVAVDLGIMTPDEVRRSVELQQDELFEFCQSLIIEGVISPQTLFALLKSFLEKYVEEAVETRRKDLHARVSKSIRDVLKKITVVAPMPATVTRLMQMMDNEAVDLSEVAKIISTDVGLTAMLLRLSNSALFGLRSQVTSIQKAVSVIGIKKLRQLILSAAIMDNFKRLPPELFSHFWEYSMRTGQWCKELAQFAGKTETDEYFLAGFLHNIGELVVVQHFPAESKMIDEKMAAGKSRVRAEQMVMGCDHADIGSYLLSLWQLTPPGVQAAMLHHHPRINLQQMSGVTMEAKVVSMAAAIVESSMNKDPFTEGAAMGQTVEDYKTILSIEYRKIVEMRDRVEKTVSELMRWFSV